MFLRSLRMFKIQWVLMRYGLYEFLFYLPYFKGMFFLKPILWLFNGHKNTPMPIRIRLAMEDLGPTFIKLGQALSTRSDLLPEEYVKELSKLQDNVPPFSGAVAIDIIEKALGKSVKDIFVSFEIEPIAAASIAQVHEAYLEKGARVAVKVVRPNIRKMIERDVALMEKFASLIENHLVSGKRLRPREVVLEYKKTILNELDLTIEAANGTQLKRNFENSHELYVPTIYWELTRKNVMVMEFVSGIPIDQIETLKAAHVNIPLLAERSVQIFFKQVFVDSFFHADMHPGNIFVDITRPENPSYIALDYGIVGTLNAEDKHYLASNFLAFFNRDYREVAALHIESGWVSKDTALSEFESAIRSICEPIFNKPLSEISFGGFLLSLFQTGRRFNMIVQPQLVLLQRTLFSIEGIGRQLYPQLDLWKTAKPFLVSFVKDQKGPKAALKNYKEQIPGWVSGLPEFLNNVHKINEMLAKDEFYLNLSPSTIKQYEIITQIQNKKKIQGILGGLSGVVAIGLWVFHFTGGGIILSLLALFWIRQSLKIEQ